MLKVLRLFPLLLLLVQCSGEQSGTIKSSDGVDIYYEETGTGNRTLIFLHGFAWTSDQWTSQVQNFSSEFKVVNIDFPGHGKSGQNRSVWTIDNYGNDILALVDKLHLTNVILIGHSMGGLAAMAAAIGGSKEIKGLVLVDIVSDPDTYRSDSTVENLISNWKVELRKDNLEGLDATFFHNMERTLRYNDMLPEETPDVWWDIMRKIFNWMNEDMKPTLKQIDVPVVLINADHPNDTVAIKKYLKDFHLRIIPQTSHFLMWDKPEEFNQILKEELESF
jgi:pimeloyl-ACP methyl ester carboxylesterase